MAKKIDKQALRKQIQELNIDNDIKAQLLSLVAEQKRYGLVWENSTEEVEESLRENIPVLTEVKNRAIIKDNETQKNPNHILIEGDNLEALTALTYTHEGKVDIIYIDPPYNTGNKDFVYNDSYVDSEDSYRHSKWLSFMSKRLTIAKRLLSDKGVIFISIDDNEQSQLKLLCDEVFGMSHYAGTLVWFKKRKGSFLSNKIVSLTEYIHVYLNDSTIQLYGGKPDNSESQPIIKRTNSLKILHFNSNIVKTKLPDGEYQKGVYGKGSSASELLDDIIIKDGVIVTPFKIRAPFVWGQDFLDEEIKKGTEVMINTTNFQVRVIRHNNDSVKAMSSFIDGREINATNEDAYELLKSIFAVDRPFQYSKPVNLIKILLNGNSYFNKKATILDFFAGSGTTLHATMKLNAEDGGHRQCILVTNNENNICEDVTYERNKRVINGYITPKGNAVDGLTSNNLRYFICEKKSRDMSHQSKKQLVLAMTDLLRIKEDIYSEQEFFGALPLKGKSTLLRFFKDVDKQMLIVYDTRVLPFIIKEIEKMDGFIKVYIFADGAYPYTEDFLSVADKVELIPLPHAFNSALKYVLPNAVEETIPDVDLTQEEQAEMMAEAIAVENNE